MSYDVTIGCWEGNYTANVSPMWADAIGENLGDVIERCPDPADLLPHVERGIAAMIADPAKYRAMDPPNGWGNYDGALNFLLRMAEACRNAAIPPKASVWR